MTNPLDQYLDDHGRTLRARTAVEPPRHRAGLLRFAVAGAAALLLAVLVLTGALSNRGVDPVAEARAALSPSGEEIVYLRIAWTAEASRGVGLPRPRRHVTEQWTAADPLRWRFVQAVSRRGRIERQESAFGAGRASSYDPRQGRLTIRDGLSEHEVGAGPPGPFAGNPETALGALLASERVVDLGEVDARGRAVRRLRVEQPTIGGGRVRAVLIYDVDPQAFTPVGGEVRRTLSLSDRRIELVLRSAHPAGRPHGGAARDRPAARDDGDAVHRRAGPCRPAPPAASLASRTLTARS
jgi:hypothetical protein